MKKYPLVDLLPELNNGKINVECGEASGSNCSGTVSVIIPQNGKPATMTREVNNLNRSLQTIVFDEFKPDGKIYPVVATLTLDSGESKTDNEIITF